MLFQTIPWYDVRRELPNVLLLGNGILKSCATAGGANANSWADSIQMLSKKADSVPEKIPYSLRATVTASSKDDERHKEYEQVFCTADFADDELLRKLVSLGFDAILTTNYTYEIENVFRAGYSALKDKRRYAYTVERTKTNDSRFLLHTYNQFENSPPIWHIHGEMRRRSSVVLTHDEYARLIQKLLEENTNNQNKYVEHGDDLKYKSWLDYFVMSNLYIVGLGMDFSELDLWWLLNRRAREKAATGKVVFFPNKDTDEALHYALAALGVTLPRLSLSKTDDAAYYRAFYQKAMEYINDDLIKLRGVL